MTGSALSHEWSNYDCYCDTQGGLPTYRQVGARWRNFPWGATMQDLSDFALPCTVTQVLYNGPMYISPEEDLSGQIFNLGSVGSVLPSDLQGIQADGDGSQKLGLQTRRMLSEPTRTPSRIRKKNAVSRRPPTGPSGPTAQDLSTFSGGKRCSGF